MFRRIVTLALVALCMAGVASADDAWFDMEKCAFCKNLAAPGLMDNMTWEGHNVDNGIVALTMVQPKYLDAYRQAHSAMVKAGQEMEAGKMMDMCGSCQALGACLMNGAKMQYVETSNGDIWVITSDSPEVIADLQSWSERNKTEPF